MLKLILASQHTNFEVNSFITTQVSIVKKKKNAQVGEGAPFNNLYISRLQKIRDSGN